MIRLSNNKSIFFSSYLGRVVCFIAVLLGVFSLASLITALVLNSKSPDHISSHFAANMLRYQTDAGSRNKIDLLQIKYECCGTDIWIDWSHANLNTTAPVIDGTSTTIAVTTSMGMPTTMGSIATTAPPVITTMGSVATTVPPLVTTDSNVITTAAPPATPTPPVTIAVDTTSTSASSRKKRQVVGSYGNIPNLPLSFGVVLPKSCCTPEATLTSNGSDACKYSLVFYQSFFQKRKYIDNWFSFALQIVFRMLIMLLIIFL